MSSEKLDVKGKGAIVTGAGSGENIQRARVLVEANIDIARDRYQFSIRQGTLQCRLQCHYHGHCTASHRDEMARVAAQGRRS